MTRASHLPLTLRAARRLAPAVAMMVLLALAPAAGAKGGKRPSLRVTDVRAEEAAGTATFTVRLKGRPRGAATVRYSTVDGTAIAGDDYVAASGRLRFTPRHRVRRVTVGLLNDGIHEPEESFSLRLSKPKRAKIVDRLGVATIVDDDLGIAEPLGALVLNEVDYDQVGADEAEFVEVLNVSAAEVDLTGVELHLVNGSTLSTYATVDLSAPGTLPAGGYLLVAMPPVAGPPGTPTIELAIAMQNGPDGLAMVHRAGEACTVVDALSYEGELQGATLAGCEGSHDLVEGTATTAADSNADPGSLGRIPNGADTGDAATDWTFSGTPTPGSTNAS